jgi:hypothetical protein
VNRKLHKPRILPQYLPAVTSAAPEISTPLPVKLPSHPSVAQSPSNSYKRHFGGRGLRSSDDIRAMHPSLR